MIKKIIIEGMSCGHCVKNVEGALNALKGAENVRVDLKGKCATLEATETLSDEEIKEAIENKGFDVIEIN